MVKHLPFLISGAITAMILFQSILIAPAINKLIPLKDASVFLRDVWPKFFLIIGILSLVSFMIILLGSLNQNIPKYLSVISCLLMGLCYVITPYINEAKDVSNEQLWTILHLATVLVTLVVLFLNVLIVFCWKFSQ